MGYGVWGREPIGPLAGTRSRDVPVAHCGDGDGDVVGPRVKVVELVVALQELDQGGI